MCDVISSFQRGVNDIFVPLEWYAAWIGSYRRFGTKYFSYKSYLYWTVHHCDRRRI